MADYGVVEEGFLKKPTTEIQADIEQSFKNIYGDSINLDASSPEGQIVQVMTPLINDLWELAQQSYNAFAPKLASNKTLDHLVKLNGINRSDVTYSTALLQLSGSDGTIVTAGSLVRSQIDIASGLTYVFATEVEVIIGNSISGQALVNAVCTTEGAISIGPNLITNILTPTAGLDTATNPNAAVTGSGIESDSLLRKRRELAIGTQALSTVDAIQARINSIDTVKKVVCLQNDTETTVDGLLPYSIKAIVQGSRTVDEVQEVGEAIFSVKSPGVNMNGGDGAAFTEEVIVIDNQGFPHDIIYAVPEDIPIYIKITTEVDDLTAPVDIGETIIASIVDYWNDSITGFTIGDDAYYGRMYTPVNAVPDHQVTSLTTGITYAGQAMADITIDVDQLARVFDGNDGANPYIEVTVVRI